jgi:hypothetical protein
MKKEQQRHATNNHTNLSELAQFCLATLFRKPQTFHHPKRSGELMESVLKKKKNKNCTALCCFILI